MSLAFPGALQIHQGMFHSLSVLQPPKYSRLPNGACSHPFTLVHLDASLCIVVRCRQPFVESPGHA